MAGRSPERWELLPAARQCPWSKDTVLQRSVFNRTPGVTARSNGNTINFWNWCKPATTRSLRPLQWAEFRHSRWQLARQPTAAWLPAKGTDGHSAIYRDARHNWLDCGDRVRFVGEPVALFSRRTAGWTTRTKGECNVDSYIHARSRSDCHSRCLACLHQRVRVRDTAR